jgi:hypothetical protein
MVSPLFNGYFNEQSLLQNNEVIGQVHPLSYTTKCENIFLKERKDDSFKVECINVGGRCA